MRGYLRKIVHKSTAFLKDASEKFQAKAAIKTGISAILGWYAGSLVSLLIHANNSINYLAHSLWASLAAIVVQQSYLGSTHKSAWNRILGVFIGCVVGAVLSELLGVSPAILGLSIFLTASTCAFFKLKESIRIACITVGAIMGLWRIWPASSPWVFATYRFIDTALGIASALLVAHLIWPLQARKKIAANIADAFEALIGQYHIASRFIPLNDKEARVFDRYGADLNNAMSQNKNFLDESKLDLLTQDTDNAAQVRITGHLRSIRDSIQDLSYIPKANLSKIIDEGLAAQALNLNQLNELAMHRMALNLKEMQLARPPVNLEEGLQKMRQELARYRANRGTRMYDLEDVQAFFVYFFEIRVISNELMQAQSHIKDIISG